MVARTFHRRLRPKKRPFNSQGCVFLHRLELLFAHGQARLRIGEPGEHCWIVEDYRNVSLVPTAVVAPWAYPRSVIRPLIE
jgi:hypothetical protein